MPLPEWVATIVRRHVATYGQRLDDNLIVNEVGGFVSRGYARLYILRPALVRAGLMGHIIQVAGPDDATPTWNATWTDRAGTTHAETFTTEASAVRVVARRHHLRRRHGMGFVTHTFRLWSPSGLTRCTWPWRQAIQIPPSPCEPTRTPPRMPRPGSWPLSPTSKWTDPRVFSFVPSVFLFGDPSEVRKGRFRWSG